MLVQSLIGAEGAPLEFWWTPGIIGAVYCAAAVSGGRWEGSYWSTGPVLLGSGALVIWLNEAHPDVAAASAHAFGMGIGVTLAALAGRAGARVDFLSAGLTAVAAGLVFMLTGRVHAFDDATTFAVLLGIIAIANLGFAARPAPVSVAADDALSR